MKKSELNNKVLQKMNDFESLEDIQPSTCWHQSLMGKLASAKPYSKQYWNLRLSDDSMTCVKKLKLYPKF